MEKKTVVVNLLAGPGAGKTTCAWAIASELKKRGIEAEYVSEYAKDLVWDERFDLLDGAPEHQKAIYEEQDRRVQRLLGKVDVVVTDSPSLLSLMYIKEPDPDFTKDVLSRFNSQQNFNLFINRGKTYQQIGRLQTLDESKAIDRSIINFLQTNGIYYGTYYHSTLNVLVDNIIKNFKKVNPPTITNFPMTNASADETLIVDPDRTTFLVQPENGNVVWIYYNPDSISEGQFVRNVSTFEDIQKAAELHSDPDNFFDYLGSSCKQELIDNNSNLFPAALKEFNQESTLLNCTQETMDALITASKGSVLYDAKITPTDELRNKIKTLAASYEDDPQTIAELIAFKARFYQYSMRNTMLIQASNPRATFVGSFNKFKELGYSVNKGEHGIKILVPVQVTLFRESPESEWIALSKATKAQQVRIKAGEFETKKILSFKAGTVFDISQTTCPIEDYPKFFNFGAASDQHKQICNGLSEFSEKELGCPVSETDFKSIAFFGQFDRVENTIKLNEKMEDTQRLSTLTHELGHAVMHRDIGQKPLVQVELEADAFSIMLNSRFGIELTDTRKSHLAGHYNALKEYNASLSDSKDVITLDTVIENSSKMYEQHIETIERYVFPQEAIAMEFYALSTGRHEIDVLSDVLDALKIDDVRMQYGIDGLEATDGDNAWKGAAFFKFLAEEAFVYESSNTVLGISDHLLSEFKDVASQYGVTVADNRICNVVPYETLKRSVSDLRFAIMDPKEYEALRQNLGRIPHSVLIKNDTANVAFSASDREAVAKAIIETQTALEKTAPPTQIRGR